MTTKNRATCKVNAMTNAQLVKHLLVGDMGCRELADETGMHYVTVLRYCRELYKAGAAHIAGYEPDCRGRHVIKVYKLGKGRDAVAPTLSGTERSRRRRARLRLATQVGLLGGVHAPA